MGASATPQPALPNPHAADRPDGRRVPLGRCSGSALWNVSWGGRRLVRPQLMRIVRQHDLAVPHNPLERNSLCRESSATHGVGNMETWLAGGAERAEIFKQFSSGYRIYRHPKDNKVAIVWENADLPKLEAALAHPDTEKAKAKHTVREPIDVYVEVEGGR